MKGADAARCSRVQMMLTDISRGRQLEVQSSYQSDGQEAPWKINTASTDHHADESFDDEGWRPDGGDAKESERKVIYCRQSNTE